MWLILGAGGQLGRALSSELCKAKIDHVSLGRHDVDVTNYSTIFEAISKYDPELVVNCSAYTDVSKAEDETEEAFLVNCTGAMNVASACSDTATKLIHISTDYVFAGDQEEKYKWFSKRNPQNIYGQSKNCGEEMVLLRAGHLSKIIRTAWLYSEYSENFAKMMVRCALMDKEVEVATDQIGTPTSAIDLARFIIDLHVSGAKDNVVYHGVGFGWVSRYEFVREIYKIVGADPDLVGEAKKSDFPSKASRPDFLVLDNSTLHGGVDIPMKGWYYQMKEAIPRIVDSVRTQE
jgi:dTDP-4-dehydrorhamnose reductase